MRACGITTWDLQHVDLAVNIHGFKVAERVPHFMAHRLITLHATRIAIVPGIELHMAPGPDILSGTEQQEGKKHAQAHDNKWMSRSGSRNKCTPIGRSMKTLCGSWCGNRPLLHLRINGPVA